jgi:NADP-dependent 3-hydroxy acid dehydrogenase YdfG
VRLAAEGAALALIARESTDLQRLSQILGKSAITIMADLARRDQVIDAAERIEKLLGVPDIIVNNAGAFHLAPLEEITADIFERSLAVNVMAPFMLARAFLPAMRARRSGHIVTVGSVADRTIYPENAAYNSSKYGLRALHEVLRLETRGSGVRATLVSPGPVDTRLWDPIDPDNREGFTPRDEMLDPAAVADAIVYTVLRPPHVDIEELRLSRS